MRPTDYGPIPVSRFKHESGAIYEALEGGRRVLISRHGEIVAAIDPPTDMYESALAAYAVRDKGDLPVLTASEINRGSPSEAVRRAESGVPSYVSKGDRVYGVLRPVRPGELSQDELTLEEIRLRERIVANAVESSPPRSPADLAAIVSSATEQVRRTASHLPGEAHVPMKGNRVGLVIGDTPITATLVEHFTSSGFKMIKTESGAIHELEQALRQNPDVVVFDTGANNPRITLPGLDAVRFVKAAAPNVPIVVLTHKETPEQMVTAVESGAWGLLAAEDPIEEIVEATAEVASGAFAVSPSAGTALLAGVRGSRQQVDPSKSLEKLTQREIEVLNLLAEGMTTRDIAAQLSIAVRTAQSHVKVSLRKLMTSVPHQEPEGALENR